ncbi:MAG: hypothetical protein WBG57_09805 [Ornithinimicrobium sp.]
MKPNTLSSAPLGTRVVVRYLIEDGERATDVLGTLTERTAHSITVDSPTGLVEIASSTIVAGKEVPPPPARRNRLGG